MTPRKPPALAAWLLDRLGYTRQNAALAGDLLEEFQSGRPAAWYWRQTVMVIVNGVGRNAARLQAYVNAILAGYAVQFLVVFTLWRFHLPPALHISVWMRVALWLLFNLGTWAFLSLVGRLTIGPSSADLKRAFCAGEGGPQQQSAIIAMVAFQTFAAWLSGYCMCALILIPFSGASLIGFETFWLVIWELTPVLAPAPVAGSLPAEEAPAGTDTHPPPAAYAPHDLGLPVSLSGGRTIVLRPETLVESVFAEGDRELAAALFQHGASLELLRRAIWLGCARNYLGGLARPAAASAIGLTELAVLVKDAARTPRVDQAVHPQPAESRWRRLRRRLRSRAA
jgi:hypothetical protein